MTANRCWFKPGCSGVPMRPGGWCAECSALVEKRARTIGVDAKCAIDISDAAYRKLRAKCAAVDARAAKKAAAAQARVAEKQGAKA